jgi:hypothetical protein
VTRAGLGGARILTACVDRGINATHRASLTPPRHALIIAARVLRGLWAGGNPHRPPVHTPVRGVLRWCVGETSSPRGPLDGLPLRRLSVRTGRCLAALYVSCPCTACAIERTAFGGPRTIGSVAPPCTQGGGCRLSKVGGGACMQEQGQKSRVKGVAAQKQNILAAKTVAKVLRSSLGPKGMDKMLQSPDGDVCISKCAPPSVNFAEPYVIPRDVPGQPDVLVLLPVSCLP